MPMLVGIPRDLDLALFAFGKNHRALSHRKPFRRALAREMHTITDHVGRDNVLYQLELPVELILTTSLPAAVRQYAARWLVRHALRVIEYAPPGARFGVHLCTGDLGNKSLVQLSDTAPLVALVKAIVDQWPIDAHPVEYVHVPLAAGELPPSPAPEFYAPLSELAGTQVRLIAGLAHEAQSFDEQHRILGHVEEMMQRRVDVAAACGLGRRPRPDAEAVDGRLAALAVDVVVS